MVWIIKIKVILEAHGLWEVIEPKENTQVDDKKDKATMDFLYQALTEDVILQVASCKMAKELWESLKKRHVGEEKVQQEQSSLVLEDDEPSLLMTTHKTEHKQVLLNEGKIQPEKYATADTSIWYLDNGASNHMTGTKSHFRDIDESITRRAFSTFKEFRQQIEMEMRMKLRMLRTDREALYNRKPNLENLRIFRCTAYAKIPIPHLKKLDDRSIQMIYLRIEEGSKACRLYDPKGKRKHVSRDVFKTKRDAKGKIIKYNAQLVAKGYVQEQGIDFDEVFAPVAQIETVHLILALAAYHGWQVHHLDVKLAFLHEDLKEEVYVTQPKGIIQQGNSGKVYKLTKALKEIELFKSQIEDKFEMSNLGLLAYYLGIELTQTSRVITIIQTGYINKILKETSMMESNYTKIPMDPDTKLVKAEDGNSVDATYYRSLIGSLRYLLHTRPDLSYSVGILSTFMQDPKDHHLKAVKQVIGHIKGTKEHGIIYKKEGGCKITGYNDSSYRINTDQGKGTTGIVFYFGESDITWCTQKQPTIALSSCESEFMAATRAAYQALWLKRLLSEITGWEEERITLKVDNISAIALIRT
nr:ribonuclease H-like domain, reverse transcriptase, RNA-dependent DNA polymerase [Tanacetum cinerariifolium]